MALEGIAAEVTVEQVHALLLARTPAILDTSSSDYALFETEVESITAEVVTITGSDPEGAYRDLAVRAIAVGVAAQIEWALFPEQQLGDTARAVVLEARYEKLLARLGAASAAAGDMPTVARPVGSFPAARGYPDAAEPTCWPGTR